MVSEFTATKIGIIVTVAIAASEHWPETPVTV